MAELWLVCEADKRWGPDIAEALAEGSAHQTMEAAQAHAKALARTLPPTWRVEVHKVVCVGVYDGSRGLGVPG